MIVFAAAAAASVVALGKCLNSIETFARDPIPMSTILIPTLVRGKRFGNPTRSQFTVHASTSDTAPETFSFSGWRTDSQEH